MGGWQTRQTNNWSPELRSDWLKTNRSGAQWKTKQKCGSNQTTIKSSSNRSDSKGSHLVSTLRNRFTPECYLFSHNLVHSWQSCIHQWECQSGMSRATIRSVFLGLAQFSAEMLTFTFRAISHKSKGPLKAWAFLSQIYISKA